MITGLYASLLGFLYIYLSFEVIKLRRKHQVSVGDGGVEALALAIATHANASQYIPIGILLLLVLEMNLPQALYIHIAGLLFLLGRILHSQSLVKTNLKCRIRGMQLTFLVIIGLAIANIGFYCYRLLF